MRTKVILLTLALAFTTAAFAADTHAGPAANEAATAFERMKSLVGQWEAVTTMGKFHLTYELASGGHLLLEHATGDTMHENMVTTYYLDGDKLELTHYCELGNDPHMVARKINLDRNEIGFDFAGAANLASPQATHMHSASFQLIDADHFNNAWTLFENGKPKMTLTAQYARIK